MIEEPTHAAMTTDTQSLSDMGPTDSERASEVGQSGSERAL